MEPNFIDKFLADNSDLADEYLSHPDKPDVSNLLRAYLISTKGYGNPSHIVHLLRMGLETLRSAKVSMKDTMTTAYLEGDDLDFWVAKAEGYTPEREDFGVGAKPRYAKGWIVYLPEPKIIGTSLLGRDKSLHPFIKAQRYSPCNNWAQGGPIKEENRVGTYWIEEENQWRAGISMHGYTPEFNISQQHGPTELVAAMRTFVHSKFGDEVTTSPPP